MRWMLDLSCELMFWGQQWESLCSSKAEPNSGQSKFCLTWRLRKVGRAVKLVCQSDASCIDMSLVVSSHRSRAWSYSVGGGVGCLHKARTTVNAQLLVLGVSLRVEVRRRSGLSLFIYLEFAQTKRSIQLVNCEYKIVRKTKWRKRTGDCSHLV